MNDNTKDLIGLINRIVVEFDIDLERMPNPTAGYSLFLHKCRKANALDADRMGRIYSEAEMRPYICDIMEQMIGINADRAKNIFDFGYKTLDK